MGKINAVMAFCLAIIAINPSWAQFSSNEASEVRLSGEIVDEEEGTSVPYVTIANISKEKMTVSDEHGKFTISFDRNDSLEFSALGYNTYPLSFKDSLSSDEYYIRIALSQKAYELESVNIYAYKDEASFKKAILDMEIPEEEKQEPIRIPGAYYGPKKPPSPTGPISFLTSKFGKRARFEKKLQQIREDYEYNKVVNQKFNREMVAELTGLTDDMLDKFMQYCKLEDDFVVGVP